MTAAPARVIRGLQLHDVAIDVMKLHGAGDR
jgi:hypothetical protein